MPFAPPVHKPRGKAKGRAPDRRPSAHARGYGARWERLRALILGRRPLCVACQQAGRVTAATDLDHIVPHKGDHALFWDVANLQPLCKPCHSRKTVTEDGGFGR